MSKYQFKDVIIYLDRKSGEIRLSTTGKKGAYREDTFVRDGKTMRYSETASSVSYSREYSNPEDKCRWAKFVKKSVVERLLGLSFDDEQEFSIDELKALELAINAEHKRAYSSAYEAIEPGTGDFDCVKKGDLLFCTNNDRGYIFTDAKGGYSLVLPLDGNSLGDTVIISPDGYKTTAAEHPNLIVASLTRHSENPYGVFPDRSYYLDAAEYPGFSAAAYNNLLAKQKQKDDGEPSNGGK